MLFSGFDLAIVVIYLAASVGFGVWVGRGQKDTTDYFLAGRQIPWFAVSFSIVATETSVLTFISIPAVAYQGNLTFIQIVLGYMIGRLLVAGLMLPAYYRGDINTAYHFLGERFGQKMRNTASITFMITRVLADGVRLYATAIPLAVIIKGSGAMQGFTDGQFYAMSILAIGILTIIYTYVGGIRSVIWMDVIQMTIYMGGAVIAGVLILNKLPDGFQSVIEWAKADNKLQWLYLGNDLSFGEFIKQPYTIFTGIVAGAIFSLASHGTDQIIVQRVLTCKNQKAAQKAMVVSGIAVFVQFLLFLFLGAMLFAFYSGQSYEALGLTRADGIFPKFIVEEMPSGLSGLIVAALFAAAMSTLSSSLSSLSSAAALDIYAPLFGRDKKQSDLLKVSRYMTIGWGLVLIFTALLFIDLEGTVVEVALSIASYTYGGLLGVFLLGLINQKSTQRDAIIGFVAAIVIMTAIINIYQIAWPFYTIIGSVITMAVGSSSRLFSTKQ